MSYSDENGEIGYFTEDGKWEYATISKRYASRMNVHFHNFLPSGWPAWKGLNDRAVEKVLDAFMSLDVQSGPWSKIIGGLEHIAPLRTRVPWYTGLGRRSTSVETVSGETLARILASAEKFGRPKKTLRRRTNDWISGKRNVRHKLDGKTSIGISNVQLRRIGDDDTVRSLIADEPGGVRGINIAAMGEGVSQLLPVVAICLRSRKGQCLVAEQPEIHLHPAAQAELGDLFVEITRDGSRQVIVETHSEHLLLRIRRHVAEGNIKPESVSVLFVEKSEDQPTVRRLPLNGDGHFDEWPEGFFDTAYTEALALAKSGRKRGSQKKSAKKK